MSVLLPGNDIVAEGVALVASLSSNSSLPSKIIPEIVSSFNQMTDCTLDYLKQQVLEPLKDERGYLGKLLKKLKSH